MPTTLKKVLGKQDYRTRVVEFLDNAGAADYYTTQELSAALSILPERLRWVASQTPTYTENLSYAARYWGNPKAIKKLRAEIAARSVNAKKPE